MSSLKIFDKIQWHINQPLSSLQIINTNGDILSKKVPIKKGDAIVILTYCTNECGKTS